MKKTIALMVLAWVITAQNTTFASAPQKEQKALLAYLSVKPGSETRFLEAANPVIEKSRQEPGNLLYILPQSETEPQQFVFYELFRNNDALEAHRKSAHVMEFLKTVEPMLVPAGFVLKKYEPRAQSDSRIAK